MVLQEGFELLQGLLALARRSEQHRLCAPLHVDEDGDVVVAPFACGLVQPDGLHGREVKVGYGLAHIVLDDSPQPLVGNPDDARGSIDWYLPCQCQGGLLEKQREGAALACPKNLGQLDAVLGTLHPGD